MLSSQLDVIGVRKEIHVQEPMIFNDFSAFADGNRDARDGEELSVHQKFFEIQNEQLKEFVLLLNVTNLVNNGQRDILASGTAQLNVFINDPPRDGTCTLTIHDPVTDTWIPAETGRGLLDEFKIDCQDWIDPNEHQITKYVVKSK